MPYPHLDLFSRSLASVFRGDSGNRYRYREFQQAKPGDNLDNGWVNIRRGSTITARWSSPAGEYVTIPPESSPLASVSDGFKQVKPVAVRSWQ